MTYFIDSSKDTNGINDIFSYVTIFFTIVIGIVIIIVCICFYKYKQEKKRITNMLRPHLDFKNNLSFRKKDRCSEIAKFYNLYEMIRSTLKQEVKNHCSIFTMKLVENNAKDTIYDLHSYLESIIKQDYLDLNVTDYGFKTPDELGIILRRAYGWMRIDMQISLYFFAMYFNGIIVLCYNLLDNANDRFTSEIAKSTITNLSLLRLRYEDLIKRYINIHQNNLNMMQPINTRVAYSTNFYRTSIYCNEDFVELERCFVTFIKIFYKEMDVLYAEKE